MKRNEILGFITVYIIYVCYYYITSDVFVDKLIQLTIIFSSVLIAYFFYKKFFGKEKKSNYQK